MAEIQDPVTGTTRFDDDRFNDDRSTGSSSRQPDSAELRREIDRTRAQMDETFDLLEQKLTPGQLAGEVWNLFKGGSSAGANKLWQVAREHPMPAAVIGLGIGWLLLDSGKDKTSSSTRFQRYSSSGTDYRGYGYGQEYSRYGNAYSGGYSGSYYNNTENRFAGGYEDDSEHEGRLSSAAHRAKDAVGGVTDSAKETLHDARERVGDLTDRARHQASHLTDRARHQASNLKGQARYRARQARSGFWDKLEEQPLMVGAATLALGLLAGLSIPSTRKEDEMFGETRDRLFDEVKEAGREALDKGKQVANAAVDTIKQEAENSDLTAAGIAEKVRTVAKEAKNTVKEEAKKQNLVPGAGESGQESQQGQQQGATGASGTTGTTGRGRKASASTSTAGSTVPGTPVGTTAEASSSNRGATQAQPSPTIPGQTTTGPNAGGLPGTQVEGQTKNVNVEEPELAKR
jgi:ElaB/YqjD/DUF883 family membrane-anchored ribosome-binding protein